MSDTNEQTSDAQKRTAYETPSSPKHRSTHISTNLSTSTSAGTPHLPRPIRVVVADDQALINSMLVSLLPSEGNIEVVASAYNGYEAVEAAHDLHPDIVLMDIRMPFMDGLEATRSIISEQLHGLKARRPRFHGHSPSVSASAGVSAGVSAGAGAAASTHADTNAGTRAGAPAEIQVHPHLLRPQLDTKVVILTTYNIPRYRYLAHDFGASDYLLKDTDMHTLIHTLESVHNETADAPHIFDDIGALRSLITPQSLDVKRLSLLPELTSITDRERDVALLIAEGYTNDEIAQTLHVSLETVKTHVHSILRKIHSKRRSQIAAFAHENALMYKYDPFIPGGTPVQFEQKGLGNSSSASTSSAQSTPRVQNTHGAPEPLQRRSKPTGRYAGGSRY